MALELKVGDILVLKRTHACGNDSWTVERIGADIGIHCTKCGRRSLLARSYLERRVKQVTQALPPPLTSD